MANSKLIESWVTFVRQTSGNENRRLITHLWCTDSSR